MKKFKDLIYDYNDIFLAFIIIIIAAAVIFWKVSDIMAYPTFAREQESETQTELDIDEEDLEKVDVDPIASPGDDFESGDSETSEESQTTETNTETTQQTSQTGLAKDVKFVVPSGYVSSKIANKLENEGICSATEFTNAVTTLNAETKLRAGEFTIPAGSTAEDIVKIIANIK